MTKVKKEISKKQGFPINNHLIKQETIKVFGLNEYLFDVFLSRKDINRLKAFQALLGPERYIVKADEAENTLHIWEAGKYRVVVNVSEFSDDDTHSFEVFLKPIWDKTKKPAEKQEKKALAVMEDFYRSVGFNLFKVLSS